MDPTNPDVTSTVKPRSSMPSLWPQQPPPRARLGLRWVPLYLATLAAATFTPLVLVDVDRSTSAIPSTSDGLVNLIIFLPLGWALRGRPLWLVALLGCAVSGSIEAVQTLLPRSPSAWDMLANTLGALLGATLLHRRGAQRYLEASLRGSGVLVLALALLLLTYVSLYEMMRPRSPLADWGPYPVHLGHVVSNITPWQGRLQELALFDRELHPEDPALGHPHSTPHARGGPILWLGFRDGARYRLDGKRGAREGLLSVPKALGFELEADGLRYGRDRWDLPQHISQHVWHALKGGRQVGLWLRFINSAQVDLTGSQVFGIGRQLMSRNLWLAEHGGRMFIRVRTPRSYPWGAGPGQQLPRGVRQHTLVASVGPVWKRIYLDGRVGGENYERGLRSDWLRGQGLSLMIFLAAASGALALLLLSGRCGWVGRCWACIGGTTATLVLVAAGAWQDTHAPLVSHLVPAVVAVLTVLPFTRLLEE